MQKETVDLYNTLSKQETIKDKDMTEAKRTVKALEKISNNKILFGFMRKEWLNDKVGTRQG